MEKFNKAEKTYLSDRGLESYKSNLELDDVFFDSGIIVDLGAGLNQNLARDVERKKLNGMIISVDPRLALPLEKDLSLHPIDKQKRIKGRITSFKNTLAAFGNQLPFSKGSIDKLVAMYSVPFYLESFEEISELFLELNLILNPIKSEARFYPIEAVQKNAIEKALISIPDFKYKFIKKVDDYLLIINKM